MIRLRQGQPLAVPADTWRYFVSPQEAGQLCAIAAIAPAGTITVPDEEAAGLVELETALSRVLALRGLLPITVRAEQATATVHQQGTYPVVVTSRDTAGEKREEIFVALAEHREPWLPRIGLVRAEFDSVRALELGDWVQSRIRDASIPTTINDVSEAVGKAVPEFHHIASALRLDDRI